MQTRIPLRYAHHYAILMPARQTLSLNEKLRRLAVVIVVTKVHDFRNRTFADLSGKLLSVAWNVLFNVGFCGLPSLDGSFVFIEV